MEGRMTRHTKKEEEEARILERAITESVGSDGRLDMAGLFFHPDVLKRTLAWFKAQTAKIKEPRRCPFCGGEATVSGMAQDGMACAVICLSCECEGPPVLGDERHTPEGKARAVALWNSRERVDLQAMVVEFHRTGGYPVRHSPQTPSDDELRFRLRLIAEEFFEQFDACFQGALQQQLVADAEDRIRQVIEIGPVGQVDLEVLVDAWADLKYVIVGSEVAAGVDGNAVFRVVHENNLTKFGPGARRDANGKTAKPPGWTPPDIAGELERQRREEAKRT
jgi:predicted HAD superfamily Cof-like phosphohydrolase